MKKQDPLPLACRYCDHYQFEGRRGGHCDKLGAYVKGEWNSCSLMQSRFSGRQSKKFQALKLKSYVSDICSYDMVKPLKSPASQRQVAS